MVYLGWPELGTAQLVQPGYRPCAERRGTMGVMLGGTHTTSPWRRMWIAGLILMPIVIVFTFGLLVVSTHAMFGADDPGLFRALDSLMIQAGLLDPTSPAATTLPASVTPPPTEYVPPVFVPADSAAGQPDTPSPTASPSASPTSTSSPTPSPTPTITHTSTETATATWTPSPTPSQTATYTPWPTWTPSLTPVPPTDTPAPTHTPVPSDTPSGPTWTPSPTLSPSPGPSPTPIPSATPSACTIVLNTGFEAQVADLINGARQDHGLDGLSGQSQLLAAARVQATDMACNHFTGHTGSDGSTVRDRVEAQGYNWSWIGENYYVTRDTTTGPQTAFNWWMNSTLHRENILGASYTQFGVGYVYGPDSDFGGYFVVVFARPR